MSVPATRCARCVAGQCGHERCRPGGSYELRVTDVAGTSCCADCAPALLELVLRPSGPVVLSMGPVQGDTTTVEHDGHGPDEPCVSTCSGYWARVRF